MNKSIQVTRSSIPDIEDYIKEIKDIWDTRCLQICGDKHRVLEASL